MNLSGRMTVFIHQGEINNSYMYISICFACQQVQQINVVNGTNQLESSKGRALIRHSINVVLKDIATFCTLRSGDGRREVVTNAGFGDVLIRFQTEVVGGGGVGCLICSPCPEIYI